MSLEQRMKIVNLYIFQYLFPYAAAITREGVLDVLRGQKMVLQNVFLLFSLYFVCYRCLSVCRSVGQSVSLLLSVPLSLSLSLSLSPESPCQAGNPPWLCFTLPQVRQRCTSSISDTEVTSNSFVIIFCEHDQIKNVVDTDFSKLKAYIR